MCPQLVFLNLLPATPDSSALQTLNLSWCHGSGSRGVLVDLVGRGHEERLTWSAPPLAVRLSTAFFVAASARQASLVSSRGIWPGVMRRLRRGRVRCHRVTLQETCLQSLQIRLFHVRYVDYLTQITFAATECIWSIAVMRQAVQIPTGLHRQEFP